MSFHKVHLYIHTPVPLFKARVNMASVNYPIMQLVYDGVTLGSYTDIPFDATLTLGTTEGADDLGRVRIQKPVHTADTIYIARSSLGVEDGTLDVQDNAYITVWDDFRVWAKLPYFDLEDLDAGNDYKDGDVEVGDNLTAIPPVANAGPPWAGTVDPVTGLITVTFPQDGIQNSFAMAEGATLASYAWDVRDGTITVGTAADPVITATFPAGFRHVALTVTDSNGKSHTTRTPVLAIDPANDVRIKHWKGSQRLTITGVSLDLEIFDELPREQYPDGTLVLMWWDEPTSPEDRTHLKFYGWLDDEQWNVGREKTGLKKSTKLHCVDVTGRLAKLPGFPQALSRTEEESPWSYMPSLDMSKSLHYLLFWHSTALNLVDFILPVDGGDYEAMRLDASGATLLQQVASQAEKLVPDHYLTCNSRGQMNFLRDWRLDDPINRPVVYHTITEDYWNNLQGGYIRQPRVHVLRSGAILSSTSWVDDGAGNDTLPLVFSIAPGGAGAFGQGTSEQAENEGLALSQAALNKAEGHRYALLNARHQPFSFDDPSSDQFWLYEPGLLRRIQLNIGADKAAQRGLDFTEASGMVTEVQVQYEVSRKGTVIKPSVTWEKETWGYPALTFIPETGEVVPYVPPVPYVPDLGLIGGQELVAAVDLDGYIYRTTDFQTPSGSGGPTWDRVATGISETIYSFVVDPFSPGYIDGAGSIDGWIATETDIYRVEDLFAVTPTVTSVHTFGTTATASSYHWRSIQASFGEYFAEGVNPWLLCISYYGSTSGKEGTWATYSVDGGATWAAEVQVSEFYDSSTATRFNPIGVYASPKTPGLAYTAAYTETALVPLADGYVSTDWGATWTRVSSEPVDDPAEPLPRWASWPDGGSLTLLEYSGQSGTTARAVESGAVSGVTEDGTQLILAPPANTKRVLAAGLWSASKAHTGSGSGSTNLTLGTPTGTTRTDDLTFTGPADNSSTEGSFTVEWTKTIVGDWPVNRDSIVSSPPALPTSGARIRPYASANSSPDNIYTSTVRVTLRILEIELDDGTIYTPPVSGAGMIQPGHAQAGSVHLPWPDNSDEQVAYYGYLDKLGNREFRLKRALGSVITDISPSDGSRSYGINRYGFAIRSHDSNRQYVLVSVIGNDTSSSAANDMHGVYVSSDYGDTWSGVVAPVADSSAPAGRPAFEAAFGGDSEQVLFIWGPAADIRYSNDLGATVDSKTGNLSTLGAIGFVGLAGGPSV